MCSWEKKKKNIKVTLWMKPSESTQHTLLSKYITCAVSVHKVSEDIMCFRPLKHTLEQQSTLPFATDGVVSIQQECLTPWCPDFSLYRWCPDDWQIRSSSLNWPGCNAIIPHLAEVVNKPQHNFGTAFQEQFLRTMWVDLLIKCSILLTMDQKLLSYLVPLLPKKKKKKA